LELTRPNGPKRATPHAISSLEIPIQQWLCRSTGKTIHEPLVGVAHRTYVQRNSTGPYRPKAGNCPTEAKTETHRHQADGLTAMTLKPGFGVEASIDYILALRKAIGSAPRLMVDANTPTVGARQEVSQCNRPADIYPFQKADFSYRHRWLPRVEEPDQYSACRR